MTLGGLTSRRPFTLLGIVLALLVIAAFVLVALNNNSGAVVGQQSVVVATKDLAPRIPIDASGVALKTLPVTGYPQLFFLKMSDVLGTVPLVTIVSGQPVTSNLVVKANTAPGGQSQYLPIPSGYVALTIPTSEQQGVAGYIFPDDYISVIATVAAGGKVATKTIFSNLHVIRVGVPPATGNGTAPTANASSLTVVVTECQAEFITWFLTYASLKYVLESYQDYLQGTQAKDPNCPAGGFAKGVTIDSVQAAFPTLF